MSRMTVHTEEEYFLDRLQRLSSAFPHLGAPHEPIKIALGVFLGTTADAENVSLMRRLRITHVINCSAPIRVLSKNNHPFNQKETGIAGYVGLDIIDDDDYLIKAHFRHVTDYIKHARQFGGQVLICSKGPSNSSAIAIAYLMLGRNMYLLEAAKEIKDLRRTSLCNVNFMKQLVEFARDNNLLDLAPDKIRAERFGTAKDHHRLISAHLPTIYLC